MDMAMEMSVENKIKSFKEFFKGRQDDFAEQTDNGYIRLGRSLQDCDLAKHLAGNKTYGIYLIEPKTNTCWHTIIDVDIFDISLAEKLINATIKLGIKREQILPEFSGGKGYHIWLIFNEAIEAGKARRLGQIIVAQSEIEQSIEVFPKQNKVSEDGFGSLIKLPFGVHQKTKLWSDPLGNNLEPVADWQAFLPTIKKITPQQIDMIIDEFGCLLPKLARPTEASPSTNVGLPCFKRIMQEGVDEGKRDNISFRLAIYLKNQGMTSGLALSALIDWNKRNRPPLTDSVLQDKVKSAFEGDYSGYACEQDYMKEFCSPECNIYQKTQQQPAIEGQVIESPISLPEFMKKDIPPLEYYVMGLLPKKGKGMLSAQANVGKSIFSQNLALLMTCDKDKFLEKFDISSARVLYLDLEMGDSALKERFQKMCAKENLVAEKLYVQYLPSLNLSDEPDRKMLEKWLVELKIDVLIIDPLGNAWVGNENEQEQVSQLTAYLNNLIEKYGIALLVIHHWRKSTKDFASGGQMAAGSYKWQAWLDCHVTLEGTGKSLTVSSQKSRNMPRFEPFLVKLNEETLWFEFLADYEKKYDDDTLELLFDNFKSDKVAIPDLLKYAKESKTCSETTVRKLIKETVLFDVDRSSKTHYLVKKGVQNTENDLF